MDINGDREHGGRLAVLHDEPTVTFLVVVSIACRFV